MQENKFSLDKDTGQMSLSHLLLKGSPSGALFSLRRGIYVGP